MKKTFKKTFIVIGIIFCIVFCNPLFSNAKNGLYYKDYETTPVGVVVSYYTDIYSRGFAWTTMAITPDSTVQYIEVQTDNRNNVDWSKATGVTGNYVGFDNNYYCHKAIVYDLTPGKDYYYRVGSTGENRWSDVGLIKVDVDPYDAFTFLFTTDSQQSSMSGFQYFANLVKAAYETHPEALFMLNGGDITNDSHDGLDHDYDQWIWAMELPKKQFMDSVFMPVAGNHDSYASSFADRFALNYQGSTEGGGYLSFDYGNVHFVLLNTNEYFSPTNSQVKWLEQDLENTDKTWKVILLHKGLVSTGDHSLDSDITAIRDSLFPLMAKYEVDLVLQGHDHVYVRSRPYSYGKNAVNNYYSGKIPNFDEIFITEIYQDEETVYSVEPNGTIYVTGNYAGSKSYPTVNYDTSLIYISNNPFTGKPNSTKVEKQMFMAITIDGNSLIYNAYTYDSDGKVTLYDQYAIQKNTHLQLVSILDQIPEIQNSTIFDIDIIAEAVNEYHMLTKGGKAKLSIDYLEKIESYIEKYNIDDALAARDVAVMISELGEFEVTEEYRIKLNNIKKSYLALFESEREYVENYTTLESAEELYMNNLNAEAVSEMIQLYLDENPNISENMLRMAYDSLTEEQQLLVVGVENIPPISQTNSWSIIVGITIGFLVLISSIFAIYVRNKKTRITKVNFLMLLLLASISIIGLSIGSRPLAVSATGRTNEVIDTNWVVNENAPDLMVEDIEEGGVGYINYRTVPSESSSGDTPIKNSITIPVKNYDSANEVLSIKYSTNMDVSAKNITLYVLVEDLNEEINEMEEELLLIGWFVNWNVIAGKSVDGFNMITIDHKNYSKAGTVTGIVMNFGYVPSKNSIAYMSLLGMDFHMKDEVPSFVTDPKPARLTDPTIDGTGYTLTNADNGWFVDVVDNAEGAINFGVRDWDLKVTDTITFDITPSAGQEIDIYANETLVYNKTFTKQEKNLVDVNLSDFNRLGTIKIVINGAGRMKIQNANITKKPGIKNYSTSSTSYFDDIKEITDPILLSQGYQVHMKRNNKAGFPKFVLPVENYREEYDVICVNVKTISGVSLLGLQINSSTYLIDHYKTDNFLEPENEYQFTFFHPYEYDENWNNVLTLYVNSNSLTRNGYNYISEFYLGITFMKSEDLKTPEYTLEKTSYDKNYDGKAVSVVASVQTPGLKATTTYYNNDTNASSSSAPVVSGSYTAKVVITGNREYKQLIVEVPIIIHPEMQALPDRNDVKYNTTTNIISFPSDYEVNISEDFSSDKEIPSGSVVEPNTTLYIRRKADESHMASEKIIIATAKRAEKPTLTIEEVTESSIKVNKITGGEYRIILGDTISDWVDSNEFNDLMAETLYTIESRVKNTADLCTSEITLIEVTTMASTPQLKAGCKNAMNINSIYLFVVAIGILLKMRKNSQKKFRVKIYD